MDAVPRFRQAPLARKIKLLLLLRGGLRLVDAGADTLLITLATDALLCLGVLLAHGQCFLKGLKMQEMGCEER